MAKHLDMKLNNLVKIVNEYYSEGMSLDDPERHNQQTFLKLTKLCLEANNGQEQWNLFLNKIKASSKVEITEFIFLSEFNPSFIAVFLTEDYQRPKPVGYEPLQLVLKISVLAPVYSIYFDNLASDWNKRLFRTNPATDQERTIFSRVEENINHLYPAYVKLDFTSAFHTLTHLGNISSENKRKPFLDECIFGLYLSIHPHNILVDKPESEPGN
jgi:hypothetical protein